jgi:hypothetical protein
MDWFIAFLPLINLNSMNKQTITKVLSRSELILDNFCRGEIDKLVEIEFESRLNMIKEVTKK